MRHSSASVVIVIPAYNGGRCLGRCLGSLIRTTDSGAHIIVVDNGSTDGSRMLLEEYAKRLGRPIELVINETNRGFPAACNQGITLALSGGADYVILLNQDAYVQPGWMDALTSAARESPEFGAIQSLVLVDGSGGAGTINSAGNPMHFLGFTWCGSYGESSDLPSTLIETPLASGAALLLTRHALEEAGLLDEAYFLYHEDADLCWRIRMAGFRVGLAPGSHVLHAYSNEVSARKYCHAERNRWMLLLKTASWARLALTAPLLLASGAASALVALKRGWIVEHTRAMLYLPTHLRALVVARRSTQARRRVTERDMAIWLTPDIDAQGLMPRAIQNMANRFMRGYWRVAARLL